MLRQQYKNTINNRQSNIFPPELSHPTTAIPKYCNIGDTEEKDLKIAFMMTTVVLKEEMNKSFKENTNSILNKT